LKNDVYDSGYEEDYDSGYDEEFITDFARYEHLYED
jgi:hypothetical protein